MAYLFFCLSVLFTVAGQLCLKKGALGYQAGNLSLGGLAGWMAKFWQNGFLMIGLLLLGLALMFWMAVLVKVKLNVAYPLAMALNLLLVVLGSFLCFKEALSWVQMAGIFTIVTGMFLLLWKF